MQKLKILIKMSQMKLVKTYVNKLEIKFLKTIPCYFLNKKTYRKCKRRRRYNILKIKS